MRRLCMLLAMRRSRCLRVMGFLMRRGGVGLGVTCFRTRLWPWRFCAALFGARRLSTMRLRCPTFFSTRRLGAMCLRRPTFFSA
jgi:hypothetical protein